MNVLLWQTGEPLHIDMGNPRPMRAMNLADSLITAGHKVELWSSAFYHQQKRHRTATTQSNEVSNQLVIRLIPSPGYKRNISIGRLFDHAVLAYNLSQQLKRVRILPDVAFVGYPPIETAAVLARWLAQRGIPSLLDVKDQWPSLFLEAVPVALRPFGRMVLGPYFYLSRRTMRDVTGLSSMSNGYLDWSSAFAGRSLKDADGIFPLTTPSGQVSAKDLEKARRWWDDHGVLDDGRPRVCFVGSFMSIFDFMPVRDAAKLDLNTSSFPCEFVLCGDGGSVVEIKALMAGLPNVLFPGWVDRPKIEALAERAQAALAPYMNIENFTRNIPNKILDALSLGLPILCPLQGEVSSLIAENGVGIRYGTDTGKSLHDCIRALKQDVTLQERMSVKASKLYKEQFSFETVYGGLVKHLEFLVQQKRSGT